MSTSPTVPTQDEPAKIGAMGRITGALFSPKETFADIARKPSWVVPVILMTLIAIGLNITLAQHVNWKKVVREQIERVPAAAQRFEQIPPDRRDQVFEQQALFAKIQRYVRGVVGTTFLVFFSGLIYWGAFRLLGGLKAKFMTAVGIVAHAALPLAVRDLIGIPIVMARNPSDINPENFVASNIGSLLPPDAPLWQLALGSAFDVFLLFMYALLIIGFAQVNPKKVSIGKSFGIVFGVWAFFLLLSTGIAFAFS